MYKFNQFSDVRAIGVHTSQISRKCFGIALTEITSNPDDCMTENLQGFSSKLPLTIQKEFVRHFKAFSL